MNMVNTRVHSGIEHLDGMMGDLYIGDNVVWYDDVGSLADIFWLNFIRVSESLGKSVIFISFDRSPKNLIEKLGELSDYSKLIILDCFTYGKGAGSDVFLRFYENGHSLPKCQIIKIEEPQQPEQMMALFYQIHGEMEGDVRIVIESLTGMQELWRNEDEILKLYAQSCPRLYELNTIAYWIIEKRAHSNRLRAHINKITQVAIELSLKRGKTALTILKAENRNPHCLNIPNQYWHKGLEVVFDSDRKSGGKLHIGNRLKGFRIRKGISQTDLARLIGVTPSNISQVENNQIYPSLPALMKIAEILGIEIGAFFQDTEKAKDQIVFSAAEGVSVSHSSLPKDSLSLKLLTPLGNNARVELYLIEIMPKKGLMAHFIVHKGEEIGYVLAGEIEMKMRDANYWLTPGDTVHLTSEMPMQWKNNGANGVKMLWIVMR